MEEILNELRNLSITLSKNKDRIEVFDPKENLTERIIADIRERKEELLVYLEKSETSEGEGPIPTAMEQECYPLSPAQERLYYLYELDKSSLAYNMPQVFKVKGEFDMERFNTAINQLVARHESLRTNFEIRDGVAVQTIRKHTDFTISRSPGTEMNIDEQVKEFIKPFDLTNDRLVRVGVICLNEDENLLIFDMHHIIADGVSCEILVQDFKKLYDRETLQPLKLQYKDFTVWLQSESQLLESEKDREFWMGMFETFEVLELPLDFKRPLKKSDSGASVTFELSKEQTEGLKELGKESGATLFMVVLTLYNVLLHKLSGQSEITVGIPSTGRGHTDLEGIIGMFVNTLPVKSKMDVETSFPEVLSSLVKSTLQCLDHQRCPLDELIESLHLKRTTNRNPLFDVSLTFDSFSKVPARIEGLQFEGYGNGTKSAKSDLALIAGETPNGLAMMLEYDTSLFKNETIDRFTAYFNMIVDQVLLDRNITPLEISLVDKNEKCKILQKFNQHPTHGRPEQNVLELLENQVKDSPEKTAIRFKGNNITYSELDEKANALANHLMSKGVGRGQLVPIYIPRSPEMIIAILGTLKAGAAYVPIDFDLPMERVAYILQHIHARAVIVASSANAENMYGFETIALDELNRMAVESTIQEKVVPGTHDLSYVVYTSGTTGKPKGVMISHGGLQNMVLHQIELFELTDSDVVLQFASISFDAFVSELFTTLISGAMLVMTTNKVINSIEGIQSLIANEGVTCVTLPPSYQTHLLGNAEGLRIVISAGEHLKQDYVKRFAEQNVKLVNAYGPSENTVCTTFSPSPILNGRVTIGKPLPGVHVYILDHKLGLCAIGCVGELCVSGSQVAKGYLHDPDLTAKVFVQNPFETEGHATLYRTGDLARWMPDGNIELLGRLDDQIKIRGYRIELGEIEHALRLIEGIEDAVVVPDRDRQNLVAYFTFTKIPTTSIGMDRIKKSLSNSLPHYMVPSSFVMVDKIPLTTNGKVNIKELKKGMGESDNVQLPKSEVEMTMLGIWSELLDMEKSTISTDSDFFELGGQSLKAMTLVNRINNTFSTALQIDDVFTKSTLGKLSDLVQKMKHAKDNGIPKVKEKEFYAVSSAQQRMYVLYELDKGSIAYNMPQFYRIKGELDAIRLRKVFRKLLNRHEILRTVFKVVNGKVAQKILDGDDFQIEQYSFEDGREQLIINDFVRPFDLNNEYPIRVGLAMGSSSDGLLLVDLHHIVNDGQSHTILLQDFWSFYTDQKLKPLPLQYRDYSEWQQHVDQEQLLIGHKSFWLGQFEKLPSHLNLPLDFKRPEKRSGEGGEHNFVLGEEQTHKLKQLAKENNVTLFVLMFAIYNVFLGKIGNQWDIVVGVPASGRNKVELEGLVGLFLNILPIRNHMAHSQSFNELLQQVKTQILDCLAHQLFQYEQLVEALKMERENGRNPLFDTVFTFQESNQSNFPERQELELTPLEQQGRNAKFDIELFVSVNEQDIDVGFVYSKDLFTSRRMESFETYFKNIVQQITINSNLKISDMKILTETEQTKLISDQTADSSTIDILNTSLVAWFEEIVERNQDRIALVHGETEMTYKELNEAANKFANYLVQDCQIKKGDIVSLKFNSPKNLIPCLLGILKSGAAYLPIDPYTPGERMIFMIRDSNSKLLVTDQMGLEEYPIRTIVWEEVNWHGKSNENLGVTMDSEHSAYIIYTSGTTGLPKGTLIPNRALVNYLKWLISSYDIDPSDQTLLMTSYAFDLCYSSLWGSMLSGATLHLLDINKLFDPKIIINYLAEHPITYLKLTPSHFKMIVGNSYFLGQVDRFELRLVILGGEIIDLEDLQKYISKVPILFVNEYGPTEATVGTIAYNIDKRRLKSQLSNGIIGKVIDNNSVFILDETLKVVPDGANGEICIAGLSVAKGYLNQPGLNQAKFVPNPFTQSALDQLMYRTGDIARRLPDGNIEFLGRIDNQVNIRGNRIELSEIENNLDKIQAIEKSIVLTVQNSLSNMQLVAFIVYREGHEIQEDEVIHQISGILPEYMIPRIVVLDEFPLTWNGKIDKKELANLDIGAHRTLVPLETAIEKELATIWAKILNVKEDEIGRGSDFFQLGGHSLLVIELTANINQKFSRNLTMAEVFDSPTIQKLADLIDGTEVGASDHQNSMLLKESASNAQNLFFFHDVSGSVNGFSDLIDRLEGFNCYGLDYRLPGFGPENITVDILATEAMEKIMSIQKSGPFNLIAWSSGGVVLHEVARKMEATGLELGTMVIIDTVFGHADQSLSFSLDEEIKVLSRIVNNHDLGELDQSSVETLWTSLVQSNEFQQLEISDLLKKIPQGYLNLIANKTNGSNEAIVRSLNTARTIQAACENHLVDMALESHTIFVKASESEFEPDFLSGIFCNVSIEEIDGDHFTIMGKQGVGKLAKILRASSNMSI